ncbi:MAG: PSD1 and planctomycete cytochrome C domain-containing protein [Candidatus Hydrogenedentes bacterium]|nr:PSD1 and planctomycete cytochrome C domain-containing protein [Candidatus Hydrogenedentota bacterium]
MKTTCFFFLAGIVVAGGASPAAAEGLLQFNRDIRPILSNNCLFCHGPDSKKRKAGLRLDTQDGLLGVLESGQRAVVPGDPAASSLIARIPTDDEDDRMPPADHAKQLTAEEIDRLTQWISDGAPWEVHWSFQTIARPDTPPVQQADWVRNPIDNFVLARLESHEIAPSPEADKRALARRLYLDLTGLPPSIADVDAFLADQQPEAYERLVDTLLTSTEHAEHMTRYWLDAARYSDTNGYHIDNDRYMWPWRDWGINAFKENKPFDEFTVEQLAGDLLPDATRDQKLASGFNRNHMINFEGGIIPEEYRAQYVMDLVDTTGTVWLGLTMNCVKCHDHKYDPISQAEYYKMFAYFNAISEKGIDGRDGNAVPKMRAATPSQDERVAALTAAISGLREEMRKPMPEVDAAQANWEESSREKLRAKWVPLTPTSVSAHNGTTLTPAANGVIVASGENPAKEIYEAGYPLKQSGITGLRLEFLPDPEAPDHSLGRAENGNMVLSELEIEVSPTGAEPAFKKVTLISGDVDYAQKGLEIAKAIDGKPDTGYGAGGHESPGSRTAVFVPDSSFGFANGALLKVRLRHESKNAKHNAGRFRISVTTDQAMARSRLDQWYIAGPYTAPEGKVAYATAYEPEQGIDLDATYPDGRQKWQLAVPGYADGTIHNLSGQVCATYLYRKIISPTARKTTLSVGSNDAIKIWLNGRLIHDNDIRRGVEKNQDQIPVALNAGENELLMKVVNYGNAYAFYFQNTQEQTGEFPVAMEIILAKSEANRKLSEKHALRDFYRKLNSPEWQELDKQLAAKREEKTAFEKSIPTAMIMDVMAEPRDTFLLKRGQYDLPGQKVEAGVPACLPPLPEGEPNNRLGFARWLVDPVNPLPARVTVNRYWQQYFGVGLVKTTEDFGSQGEIPSHPDLMNWLAAEFIESGWDVRHIHRLIVTSATYRQTSRHREDTRAVDTRNRLLAYAPRLRLDAEAVRDNALAISGLLKNQVGGPSVRPYQPLGLWQEVGYGGGFTAQIFTLGEGDELYRRSMYTFWKRTSPPPSMMLFDAPNRETCTVKRSRSNTPLQALALLNDPQFVEAARFLAERMMTEVGDTPAERLNHAFLLAVARPATAGEISVLQELYESELTAFQQEPARADELLAVGQAPANADLNKQELAAWSTVASVILNMDETITKI